MVREDVIEAMLLKLDKLASDYKEKKTTQSLVGVRSLRTVVTIIR